MEHRFITALRGRGLTGSITESTNSNGMRASVNIPGRATPNRGTSQGSHFDVHVPELTDEIATALLDAADLIRAANVRVTAVGEEV